MDADSRIVAAGLELLAAITDEYGPEEGLAVWERVSDAVGVEFKQSVFMAMLAGRTTGIITLHCPGLRSNSNFIEAIKTIRAFTGFGLKQAKDMCDAIDAGATKNIKLMQGLHRHECVYRLRSVMIGGTIT